MLVTTQWMFRKYHEFNKKYFSGKCPNNITFKLSTAVDRWGYAQCTWRINKWGDIYPDEMSITMSNAYDSPEEVKENTLIHEMIHILDYIQHPENFVTKTSKGWSLKRKYNAHGPFFFLKEAQRLSQYGFNIQKLVSAEEIDSSIITNKVQKRIDNKKAKGFIIGCVVFNPKYPRSTPLQNEAMWFKTTPNMLQTIIENCKTKYPVKNEQRPYFSIEAYLTHQEKYDEYSGCRDTIKGWYCSIPEWDKMVEEMGKDKKIVQQVIFDNISESYQPMPKNKLTDGENGIAKLNSDDSLTYRMM